MKTDIANASATTSATALVSRRADALAERLEQGALALETFASRLTDSEWLTPVRSDGRSIGVIVHHVASMYPIEIELAQTLAKGQAVAGVTWDAVHQINAEHAQKFSAVTVQEAIALLKQNSRDAAAAIRAFCDEALDQAAPLSLNADAPLTCQFMLEGHAVAHSFHHLAAIRRTLGR